MLRPAPKPERKKKAKRKKLHSYKSLMKKADTVFSKWIRNRDFTELNGKCCTCGKPGNQAGHFVSRTHKRVRWEPKNVHLQCSYCNCYQHGAQDQYSAFIINKYGFDTFQWLLLQKGSYKPNRDELERIIRAYS